MRSRCRSPSRRSRSPGDVGAPEAEVRALTVLGVDLAYLGRAEEGLAHIRPTLQLAEEVGDRVGLERAYGNLHRCADDAGPAPRVGATGAGGARGDSPVRDHEHPAHLQSDRGAARDRRLGRGRQAQRRRAPRHHLELPVLAPHRPRRGRDRPRRVRRRAGAPRGGGRRPVRVPRARPVRLLPRRPRAVGASLDGRCGGHRRGAGSRAPARGGPDPRPALRDGPARAGGAGGARTRPPERRRSPRLARSRTRS